ncbi:Glycoside hydrolase superfamily [Arabidopsis thaliana x Arabidopsis arenosa]|uniref:Glycoside hydrolase superfamily n=1 Tax=Arabidopsis thaliana x Arabidopsis arenosa TaxID=1240361 RepID=A0A8T2CCR7_9BRAS|nr:Glycoside hydrolase superfamily [Arabidopsis thaliana x Arabidopsis arenosa]
MQDTPLVIECFDFKTSGNHELIGMTEKSVVELERLCLQKEVANFVYPTRSHGGNKVLKGQLIVDCFVEKSQYSFLDYISSGFELNFMVAVDFTASNGVPRRPSSLHHIDPSSRVLNSYQQAIMESRRGCWSKGIMAAYASALRSVTLAGPTLFSHVVEKAAHLARLSLSRNSPKYFVLLIITDGVLKDMEGTRDALVRASTLPLSVVIVGVGSRDFTQIQQALLDVQATREIVQFVHMKETNGGVSVVQPLLDELPGQFLSYVRSRKINPQHGTNHQGYRRCTRRIAEIDENFVCATLDWWPPEKCNYDQCPWGYASLINLNLSSPLLAKAIQAFKTLRIRIGCLYIYIKRWDEVNHFFNATGAIVTFGLNALYERVKLSGNAWGGAWDHINTQDFMNYTVSKGDAIDSWEFGNELSGSGTGARVNVELYGKDLIVLKDVIKNAYKDSRSKPLVVAPGGFYEEKWYSELLRLTGPGVLDVLTPDSSYIQSWCRWNDPKLVNRILDPNYLSGITGIFVNVNRTIQEHGPWAAAWAGEAGGAFVSGGRLVSETFINCFWYLDQLGMSSKHNTKVYCRQALVGGFYGLLEKETFVPNPDYYYSALLWHRLMGKGVLGVQTNASEYLRAYVHCSKGRAGITILLINLSKQTKFTVGVCNGVKVVLQADIMKRKSFLETIETKVSRAGNKALDGYLNREEYHLSPKDGDLRSKIMLLNGNPLAPTVTGDIPNL